ncbi:MAG: type II toxin-antitoxin system RelE/ParE family toxin [Alphaproteobacteria bacterium]|nr:type II toxin-antitoxin system RelE/ParE family toxin [Alphaproteobacteria bacterium]
MKYKVVFQNTAIRSLERIYAYISKDSPANARRYAQKLRARCATLSRNPGRCPLASENGLDGLEIRHLIHDRYRIIFVTSASTVHVFEIRHAARLPFDEDVE